MFSCLLKRVLPFTLTFAVGATLGWLFHFQGSGARFVEMTTRLDSSVAPFGYGYGRSCRMRSRYLVAETKPLLIRFKPDARVPREQSDVRLPHQLQGGRIEPVSVWARVTFGADGKVQQVEPVDDLLAEAARAERQGIVENFCATLVWDAVERAARQIQFEPELINGLPVSVTKDVEIHFMAD